jgi:hypothetical protein
MTDKYVRDRRYQYTENASKVLQREKTGPKANLPSGESESLVGRGMKPMGDLVSRDENPELKNLREEAKVRKEKQSTGMFHSYNYPFIDVQTKISKEQRFIYNQMLMIVQRHMAEVSIDTLKEVTNEVLAILKADNIKDVERKKEIEVFLDKLTDQRFNELTVLASKISNVEANIHAHQDGEETIMVDVDLDQEGEDEDKQQDDVYAYDEDQEDSKPFIQLLVQDLTSHFF